ncbi:MAG TPA: 16S rRNA (guanine(966)-N(2))-methyltransferase RsmD [Bacilli bacterium]|nr:16S rRNA (guanine(966)-N(2))-methyltransferase RsmD [Bacilli bacterium]
MRIIGGIYRHRQLKFISDTQTRPTKDRIREAVFSALGHNCLNRRVLDLFAGSGSMGLEALSRGAEAASFVDTRREAIAVIQENISNLGVEGKVFFDSYDHFLQVTNDTFNLVFIDPPYAFENYADLFANLLKPTLLNQDAIIVIENQSSDFFVPKEFAITRQYKYGETLVHILRRKL